MQKTAQSILDTYSNNKLVFIAGTLILFLVILLLLRIFKKTKMGSERKKEITVPSFEEVFEVEAAVFAENPYPTDPDAKLELTTLSTITVTLLLGLAEFLAKSSNPISDQHKSMRAIGGYLEAKSTSPIAYTQWNQSPIQGIAAKIIVAGRACNVILGPSIAMARATANFVEAIATGVATAESNGNSNYVLAVDGLAYGTFEVSHRLQEVIE